MRKEQESDKREQDNGLRLVVGGVHKDWRVDLVRITYFKVPRPDGTVQVSSYVENIAVIDVAHHYIEYFPEKLPDGRQISIKVERRRNCETLPEVITRCKTLSTELDIPMMVSLDKERAKHEREAASQQSATQS